MKIKLFILIVGHLAFAGCKKNSEEVNPLLGNWVVKQVYIKYTDPVRGLVEDNTSVEKFLLEKGFYPIGCKSIRFYDKDSVLFLGSEPENITETTGYLYADPDAPETGRSFVVDRIRGTYKIENDSIYFQMETHSPSLVSSPMVHSAYGYTLDQSMLNLIVKNVDRQDFKGDPYIHKEIWFFERED